MLRASRSFIAVNRSLHRQITRRIIFSANLSSSPAVSGKYDARPIRIALGGLVIRGLQFGDPESPHKVLATHGWMDNAGSFWWLGPKIAERGAHVVAIDLPGHGRTSHRDRSSQYSAAANVPDMFLILRRLGWIADEDVSHVAEAHWMQSGHEYAEAAPLATLAPESDGTGADAAKPMQKERKSIARGRVASLSLLGHSMGGGLSVVLAAALGPKIISRLCLVEGSGLLSKPGHSAAMDVLAALHSRARTENRLDAVLGQQTWRFSEGGGEEEVTSGHGHGTGSPGGSVDLASLDASGDCIGSVSPQGVLALGREFPSLEQAIAARCETVKMFPGNQTLTPDAAFPIVQRGSVPSVHNDAAGSTGLSTAKFAAVDASILGTEAPWHGAFNDWARQKHESGGAPGDKFLQAAGDSGPVRFSHDGRLRESSLFYMTEEQALAFMRACAPPTATVVASRGWPWPKSLQAVRDEALGAVAQLEVDDSHHPHLEQKSREVVSDFCADFLDPSINPEGRR